MSSSSQSTLQITTPESLTQCANTTIYWYGGVEPFELGYVATGTIIQTATPAATRAAIGTKHAQSWVCNVQAGIDITISVKDSTGRTVYTSPLEVQNSTDITCLPGYVPPSSSSTSSSSSSASASTSASSSFASASSRVEELSKGAIGGIAAGAVAGALIAAVLIFVVWRFKRRRRTSSVHDSDITEKVGDGDGDDGAEPKIEPYVGRGDVDLADEMAYENGRETFTATSSDMATTTASRSVGELERQTKQMLGVPTASPPSSRSATSPIPMKTAPQPSASRTSPVQSPGRTSSSGQADPSSPLTNMSQGVLPGHGAQVPGTEPEAEIEYVRHTDGGGVRVELPPLYTEVPRREGGDM